MEILENTYVKILKDGRHEKGSYKKDEILKVKKWFSMNESVVLENTSVVTLYDSPLYGKEAEFCSPPLKKYEIW